MYTITLPPPTRINGEPITIRVVVEPHIFHYSRLTISKFEIVMFERHMGLEGATLFCAVCTVFTGEHWGFSTFVSCVALQCAGCRIFATTLATNQVGLI